jgi:hypothetical protein
MALAETTVGNPACHAVESHVARLTSAPQDHERFRNEGVKGSNPVSSTEPLVRALSASTNFATCTTALIRFQRIARRSGDGATWNCSNPVAGLADADIPIAIQTHWSPPYCVDSVECLGSQHDFSRGPSSDAVE